jgi:tRNA(Ile)-lysidine synthetase-like protein
MRSRSLLSEDDAALAESLAAHAETIAGGRVDGLAGGPAARARRAVEAWLSAQGVRENLSAAAVDSMVAVVQRPDGGGPGEPAAGSSEGAVAADSSGQGAQADGHPVASPDREAGKEGGRKPAPGEGEGILTDRSRIHRAWGAGPGVSVVLEDGRLRIERVSGRGPDWPSGLLPENGCVCLPEGGCLERRAVDLTAEQATAICRGGVSPDRQVWLGAAGPLRVRRREDGDRFRPLGLEGSVLVSDALINRKVPLNERDHLPVVCAADGTIAWIPGLPPGEPFRISPSTRRASALVFQPPLRA